VSIANYDKAVEFTRRIESISNISPNDVFSSETDFAIYQTYLDECARRTKEVVTLQLTVDAYKLKDTYLRLVNSKLFIGIKTVPVPLGPDSVEIPIPRRIFGQREPTEKRIAEFIDLIAFRYFKRLRTTKDACRKHNGRNIIDYLSGLADSKDPVSLVLLAPAKSYFRRYIISGLSRDLVLGLADHWERHTLELKMFPDYDGPDYKLEITLNTGEIAAFREDVAPPADRFKPISDLQLREFSLKFAACVSKFVSGSCPNVGGSWDNGYCTTLAR